MVLIGLLLPLARAHVPLDVGDWTITELHAGPAAEGGQWFELRNNDGEDGNNLVEQGFTDATGHSFLVTGNVIAREGEYAVFASEDSTAEADFVFPASFVLAPEAGAITLVDHTRGEIDTVAWGGDWTLPSAQSAAVNPGAAASAWANDVAASWCAAAPTPGAENAWCADADDDGDGDGVSAREGDCDDADGARAPGQAEVRCDGLDQDCDGRDACAEDSGDDSGPDTGQPGGGEGGADGDGDGVGGGGVGGGGAESGAAEVGCGCGAGGAGAGPAALLGLACAFAARRRPVGLSGGPSAGG